LRLISAVSLRRRGRHRAAGAPREEAAPRRSAGRADRPRATQAREGSSWRYVTRTPRSSRLRAPTRHGRARAQAHAGGLVRRRRRRRAAGHRGKEARRGVRPGAPERQRATQAREGSSWRYVAQTPRSSRPRAPTRHANDACQVKRHRDPKPDKRPTGERQRATADRARPAPRGLFPLDALAAQRRPLERTSSRRAARASGRGREARARADEAAQLRARADEAAKRGREDEAAQLRARADEAAQGRPRERTRPRSSGRERTRRRSSGRARTRPRTRRARADEPGATAPSVAARGAAAAARVCRVAGAV
jgi:hypothetical protein